MNNELILSSCTPTGQLYRILEEVGAIEGEKLLLNVVLQTY